jgi:hypothetical protein
LVTRPLLRRRTARAQQRRDLGACADRRQAGRAGAAAVLGCGKHLDDLVGELIEPAGLVLLQPNVLALSEEPQLGRQTPPQSVVVAATS